MEEILNEPKVVEAPSCEETSSLQSSEKDERKRLDKMKKQKLCQLVKKDSLKKHPKEYQELVSNAAYLCLKCGRAAKEKTSVCKPAPLK